MSAPVAAELRPIAEVEPEILAGVRVFRHVRAHGRDLLELNEKNPGMFDGSRWLDCDLEGTEWPPELHDVTIVDSNLKDSVWRLTNGENIRIMGTKRIPMSVDPRSGDIVADLSHVRARVDGMRVTGHAPGFTLVQVAGEGVRLGDVDPHIFDNKGTTDG